MSDAIELSFGELHDVLSLYARAGANAPQEILPAVGESLHDSVLEVFDTEGFGKWPRFAWQRRGDDQPNTRRFRGGGAKLLQDTGNLVGSMTPAWDDDTAEVFTNVPYAKFHASRRPRKVIPLRDFFAIDQVAFLTDVSEMLLHRIERIDRAVVG